MNKYLVVSALGQDKPGIVKTLSKTILDNNGNICDSRMSVLGDEFALVTMVSGSDKVISEIEQVLIEHQESMGLTIICKRTVARNIADKRLPYHLNIVALDNPGIVHDVTDFLLEEKVNVEELSTTTYSAAHTGTIMFALDINVSLPADINISKFKSEFFSFCDTLNLDAEIEPIS